MSAASGKGEAVMMRARLVARAIITSGGPGWCLPHRPGPPNCTEAGRVGACFRERGRGVAPSPTPENVDAPSVLASRMAAIVPGPILSVVDG